MALLASGVDAITGDKLGASRAVAAGLTGAAAGAVERARARDALPRHMKAAVTASASNATPPSTGPMMSAEPIPPDEPSTASDGGAAGGDSVASSLVRGSHADSASARGSTSRPGGPTRTPTRPVFHIVCGSHACSCKLEA